MDKSSILVTGIGQCGGKLADLLKEFNSRYTVTYINSSLGDIKGLKHADIDTNVLIYSGADGSGRIREKGKKFFETDKSRVATFINKNRQFKHSIIFSSFDGGTGSGSLISYIKLLKQLIPTTTITVIGVLPKLKAELLNLENAKQCLIEFEKEVSKLVDGLLLINNNKCSDSNYEQINLEAISMIDSFFGMTGHHDEGSIDNGNLDNVITASGYITLLKLPSENLAVRDAIRRAKENSIFALPETLKCLYGAINVVQEQYNKDDICEKVKAKKTTYSTYNGKGMNLIALSGCNMPNEEIEDLIDTLNAKKEEDNDYEIEGFNIKDDNIPKEKPIQKENKVIFMDDEDIDALLSNPNAFRF